VELNRQYVLSRTAGRLAYAQVSTTEPVAKTGDALVVAGYPGAAATPEGYGSSSRLKVDEVTVEDVDAFSAKTADILQTSRSAVAASGSSGGGAFKDGALVGLTVTIYPLGSGYGINSLSTAWINRDLRADANVSIANLINEDPDAAAQSFWAAEGAALGLLSGDAQPVVDAVAARLGIHDARGGLDPQGKQQAIVDMQRDDRAVVAMIGDGVNDAPVLAQAHVSVAMGGGTDLARNQADIVLLNERFVSLADGIVLARRTLRIIRQNLWWSFAYNFTSVPLAMAGLVTPWMAGIGMAASSLLVVLNAMRLQRATRTERAGAEN